MSVPTAEEFTARVIKFKSQNDTLEGTVYSFSQLMIEFAKLHAEAIMLEVNSRLYETYHTVCEDGTTKGVFQTQEEALKLANNLNSTTTLYHDWIKVVRFSGGWNKEMLPNIYPLENIK